MDQQAELEAKRAEAKAEILALKKQIPAARIFDLFGKTLETGSIEYWIFNIILLNVILLLPWIISIALHENDRTEDVWIPILIGIEASVLGLVVAGIVILKILDDLANLLVDKIQQTNDLLDFIKWLKHSWSLRNFFPFVIIFSILWVFLAEYSFSVVLHEFIGFGLSLTIFLASIGAGIAFQGTFWVGLLASNLKNYHYEINTFSPIDSEVVNNINEILTRRMSAVAVYLAVITLFAGSSLVDQRIRVTFSLPIFLIGWTLLIAQFLYTRSAIGKIVSRAKWQTLNKIQTKINFIQSNGDLSEKDTAERLLRLVDIHGRVIASRSDSLDFRSISTFISQLMLPLLGLVLGFFDN